jgi:hypothetical protein
MALSRYSGQQQPQSQPQQQQPRVESYLRNVPSYLHASMRGATSIVNRVVSNGSMGQFESSAHMHTIYKEVPKITLDMIKELVSLKHLKDIIIWGMKGSEDHAHFVLLKRKGNDSATDPNTPSILQSTPANTDARPIVMELILSLKPGGGSSGPNESTLDQSPATLAEAYRRQAKAKLIENKQAMDVLILEIPFNFTRLNTETDNLKNVIKTVLSLLLIEYMEDIPHIYQCDDIFYNVHTQGMERFHYIAIKNPSTLSMRKINFIHETFVVHIKEINYATINQPQTTNVESVFLSILFTEPVGTKSANVPTSSSYIKAKTSLRTTFGGKEYSPY